MTTLDWDPVAAAAHLSEVDPALAPVIERVGPCSIEPDKSLDIYHYLIRSIVYQQLNGKAAATIHGRLLGLWEGADPSPEELLATDAEQLRSVGVSGSKAAALHDLARHVLAREIPDTPTALALEDDELVKQITVVRGIGPWTVHMLLIFRLGRPDVLAPTDYGVRAGFARIHGLDDLPTPKALTDAGESWRPFRSAACWYLWRAVDEASSAT
jgi:3-methyladenine DNA glycosylase/8-oxoguanine DNA glycosylase